MKKRKKNRISNIKKVILTVISVASVLVVAVVVCAIFLNPESRVKNTISKMASEYYEDYLYASFSKSEAFKNDPAETMKLYEEHGFSSVSLRQLLLYDGRKNEKYSEELKKYCDEETTYVKFFPEAPYSKTNYRADYTYSCEF